MKKQLIFFALFISSNLSAGDFPESAGIYLLDQQQQELKIGDVTFDNLGDDKTSVHVTMDHDQFTDQQVKAITTSGENTKHQFKSKAGRKPTPDLHTYNVDRCTTATNYISNYSNTLPRE